METSTMRKYILSSISSVLILIGCASEIETGKKGDTKLLLFEIGPKLSECQGAFPQTCMNINGSLFYDHIEGFTHTPGTTSTIEVLRTQYCDPNILNSCLQDTSIYAYKMIRLISETTNTQN